MEPMVEVKNLSKRFGPIIAVDHVSFRVGRGEVLGFLGPNGAGKSTTMRLITGFLVPDSGTVIVSSNDIALAPIAVKTRIGYLPEGTPLYTDMTPWGFLSFVAEIRGFRGEEKRRRLEQTIAKVHLEQVLEQPIGTLSKGFKRRVGLAQAILHDPEILILDEPTDGLDPNQKHEVHTLIRNMAKEKVIILSTHILEEVEAVCTRAIIIARGIVTSSAVVGSSAMMSFGSQLSANAIITRWRMPPLNWWGYCLSRCSASEMPTIPSSSTARAVAFSRVTRRWCCRVSVS